jgi:hypothetical protein
LTLTALDVLTVALLAVDVTGAVPAVCPIEPVAGDDVDVTVA